MKIAPDGSIHISYYDGAGQTLRYASYGVKDERVYLPLMTK
jgi:hypothetical protein